MSNIIIRNITGTGPFAFPTTLDQLQTMDGEIGSILAGVPGFYYLNAKAQILENPSVPPEIIAVIESFMYGGVIVPTVATVRSAIYTAFTANPNITGIGNIDIRLVPEGGYYYKYPQVDHIDVVNAIVTFVNDVPPGAQIEAYKYSKHNTGDHYIPSPTPHYVDPRKGKRYRPDRTMAKGSLVLNLSNAIRATRRNHFRFAFRWPPPNSPIGPGVRGPLGPFTISTTVPTERAQGGALLIYSPSPCSFAHNM